MNIWSAGAVLNLDELIRNEPEPPPFLKADIERLKALENSDPVIINSKKHSSDSFRDPRIKAVFALAPPIGQGFPAEGLKKITVPVQIVVGEADLIAPMDRNAAYFAGNAHLIHVVMLYKSIMPGYSVYPHFITLRMIRIARGFGVENADINLLQNYIKMNPRPVVLPGVCPACKLLKLSVLQGLKWPGHILTRN